MLVAEYDYDTDIAVQRAEERQIAFAEGIERGIEQGLEQGLEQGIQRGIEQGLEQGMQRGIEQGMQQGIERGLSEGVYQKAIETAKLMCAHNYPIAEICMMTGLSADDIANLSK